MAPPRRSRLLILVGAAALLLASACSPPAPPQHTGGPSQSAVAATASPAFTAPPTAVASAAIQLHMLDARYVPAEAPVSAHEQILWTAGEATPSEIWRYMPGAQVPERIFASARADAHIHAIAASSAGYAFVEESRKAFGKGGWRLWFLAGEGEEPFEVDRGSAPGSGVSPTIAMDGERIAWAAFDEPRPGPVSRLRIASTTNLDAVTTLIGAPIADRLLWYPAFTGQELWFATIKADATSVGDEFHLEHLDLTRPEAAPARFPGLGNDFDPAVNDRFVVWKTNKSGDAALNWGTLHALNRRSGAVSTIPVAGAARPSIGGHYVAFGEITHSRLAVFDLSSGRIVDLAPPDAGGSALYGGQSLSGQLLTFFTQRLEGTGLPQIGWAMLPG
jgi:hypothetical protein